MGIGTPPPSCAVCAPQVAPLVLDGTVNGAAFLAYTEQFLVPTLRPGDVVVLANLSSHKVEWRAPGGRGCGR
jgi:hypothetical protein